MDNNSLTTYRKQKDKMNKFYIDYIKALENPDRIGWNGKVWSAPTLKGYDSNQRGYGIDINKNLAARELTKDRPGKWLTELEADKLMRDHILYVYNAALKHIKGFDTLSDKRKAALLGMLYRGDSVNANKNIIDIMEPDDEKFFNSINLYYKSKGLNERVRNSNNFFKNNSLNKSFWDTIPQWNPPIKYSKQGGKMNILEFLKKGSGIHIKKENRGKFTDYCGGKVTSECIAKGKASSNPAIRKRATFADNARHFKHRLGGSIVEAFKLRRLILNSLNNIINGWI